MKNRIIVIAGIVLMWAGAVFGQGVAPKIAPSSVPPQMTASTAPQKVEVPVIKPEIALHIRDLQLAQAHAEAEFQFLQARIKTLQEDYQRRQVELGTAVASSLKDSGLDPAKYDVNPDTLVVILKPVVGAKKP